MFSLKTFLEGFTVPALVGIVDAGVYADNILL